MPLIISSLALHHVVNHMIVQCHRRLTKPKLGKVKCHPQIRFQIRGGLVGNCNTCSRCEAAGVHVQKTMSSRHCILPVPGIINAGRNYTNCLLGCRFGLTEAQRPCGAINLLRLSTVSYGQEARRLECTKRYEDPPSTVSINRRHPLIAAEI
jgi:hypothetical protein